MPTDKDISTPPASHSSEFRPVVLCPDCETAQQLPVLPPHQVAECHVCRAELLKSGSTRVPALLALTLSALILYFPASFMPLMVVSVSGGQREDTLLDGPIWLAQQGFYSLAVLVFLFTMVAPLVWLSGLAAVLLCLHGEYRPPWLGRILRWTELGRFWAMPEVLLVGGFVAYSRVRDLETTDIGPGGWIFLCFGALILAIEALKDRRRLWEAVLPGTLDHALVIDRAGRVAVGEDVAPEDAFTCHACHMPLVVDSRVQAIRCPRCRAYTERRKPGSLHRCAALVVAGYVLLIPANILPIMTVIQFGSVDRNTILSGVIELFSYGLWPLGVIVFMASIVVPLLKLIGLTLCMLATRPRFGGSRILHTRLYRFVEHIGRWSNIDIFMMSILVALIEFGNFARVDAEPGAVAFATVVVLTMLASHAFDPRLMWDARQARGGSRLDQDDHPLAPARSGQGHAR